MTCPRTDISPSTLSVCSARKSSNVSIVSSATKGIVGLTLAACVSCPGYLLWPPICEQLFYTHAVTRGGRRVDFGDKPIVRLT